MAALKCLGLLLLSLCPQGERLLNGNMGMTARLKLSIEGKLPTLCELFKEMSFANVMVNLHSLFPGIH